MNMVNQFSFCTPKKAQIEPFVSRNSRKIQLRLAHCLGLRIDTEHRGHKVVLAEIQMTKPY